MRVCVCVLVCENGCLRENKEKDGKYQSDCKCEKKALKQMERRRRECLLLICSAAASRQVSASRLALFTQQAE